MAGVPVVGSRVDSMAVYTYALRRGGVAEDDDSVAADLGLSQDAVKAGLADLAALRLLRSEADADGRRLVPVSPEVASAALISPIAEEIHQRRAQISGIQARLNAFRPQYDLLCGRAADGGVEQVHDAVELAGQLHLSAERCRGEFVGFRPDGWFALERVAAMAERGVRVRLLLQHSLRTDLRARGRMKEVLAGGGDVRTSGRLPQRLLIFDDEAAFLLHDEVGRADGPVGVVIRHREAVHLLRGLAETTWEAARPYAVAEIGYHEVADDFQQTVVRLLAEGLTDEAIARRLGVSVRTCRRHIATVLTTLGSVSRFQAGFHAGAQAATQGLGPLRPGAPERPAPAARRIAAAPCGQVASPAAS